ncbi:MAG: 3-oxoacyl-ACP synthase III [Candidatus Nanoarchaeia archaeon]
MDTIFSNVKIESWGYEMPEETLSSSDIEKLLSPVYERLKLPEGRLELMSGIKERRIWRKGTRPSDAAYLAGRNAISRSGLDTRDIGCLINCSVCRDCLEPATATIVHDKLKLSEDCLVFDISNACLGILTGMLLVSTMIENRQIKAGMLVAGENSRSLIESTIAEMNGNLSLTRKSIKSYFSSLTIGSGAIAMILCRSDIGGDRPILKGGSTLAVTRHNSLCQGNEDKGMEDNLDTLMNTDSERLMHEGVSVAKQTWNLFKNATGWNQDTADIIFTHQVGVAHKKLLFETLGLKPEKDFSTLEKLGNTGSVSCPLTFAIATDAGKFKKGMKAVMLGIGSGINCTMLGVEWL